MKTGGGWVRLSCLAVVLASTPHIECGKTKRISSCGDAARIGVACIHRARASAAGCRSEDRGFDLEFGRTTGAARD